MDFQGARTRYFDTYFAAPPTQACARSCCSPRAWTPARYRLAWPDGTVVYELDQPQVLEFKREVLAAHGDAADAPSAARCRSTCATTGRRRCATAGSTRRSRRRGSPKGLLIYLPATAQEQLFAGIDALAAAGQPGRRRGGQCRCRRGLRGQARGGAGRGGRRTRFFTLSTTSSTRRRRTGSASAAGRAADHAACPITCGESAGPVPAPTSDAGPMTSTISLVSAVKR